ncbi:MAG: hypothetical protein KGO47_07390 [Cyanobacteria bacterium REEB417]|nr:hypothetical protein [Cyanobacteria bacterium REEB417]
MTQTPYEAGRMFANDYAGKRARLCLANNAGSLGVNSTTAQCDAAEISGNGYARVEWTIPSGAYNSTAERFEAAVQAAVFTASSGGTGLAWNFAYLVLGTVSGGVTTWNTGVSYVLVESPSVALAPGEPRTYNITLFTDGFLVTA